MLLLLYSTPCRLDYLLFVNTALESNGSSEIPTGAPWRHVCPHNYTHYSQKVLNIHTSTPQICLSSFTFPALQLAEYHIFYFRLVCNITPTTRHSCTTDDFCFEGHIFWPLGCRTATWMTNLDVEQAILDGLAQSRGPV